MSNFNIKNLQSIFDSELETIKKQDFITEQEGRVISIGDGIAKVSGLSNVMLNEIVLFENGTGGIVLNLETNCIGVVLLGKYDNIEENQPVYRTNKVFEIPVGFDFVGRIIDANAKPIDGKGAIKAEAYFPVEKIAPGVMARQSVDEPLETGILSIDAMFPIGKGQRELIIGDRQTGKTTIATDTIINQKGKDVYCIYVAIGQKNSTIAALVRNLQEQGAMDYTTVVSASASELPALQYLAPYTGVTLAEYFMSKGKNVLIVYDDLSKHAVAYRTLSLLLKRPPGREAYPGDVFYLHSRLLERACRLNPANGGGSITALPIIETQAGDISAYIPTNVISITDGQIFMMNSLFNSGQRPAIDAGLSVSRVGGAAQIKCVKQAASSLKLDLANYRELAAFSQFGSDLDETTKATLERGARAMQMLRQLPNKPYNQIDETVLLFLIKERFIDLIPTSRIIEYKEFVLEHISQTNIWNQLADKKAFDDKLTKAFRERCYIVTLEFLGLIKHDMSEEEVSNSYAILDTYKIKYLSEDKKVEEQKVTASNTQQDNNESNAVAIVQDYGTFTVQYLENNQVNALILEETNDKINDSIQFADNSSEEHIYDDSEECIEEGIEYIFVDDYNDEQPKSFEYVEPQTETVTNNKQKTIIQYLENDQVNGFDFDALNDNFKDGIWFDKDDNQPINEEYNHYPIEEQKQNEIYQYVEQEQQDEPTDNICNECCEDDVEFIVIDKNNNDEQLKSSEYVEPQTETITNNKQKNIIQYLENDQVNSFDFDALNDNFKDSISYNDNQIEETNNNTINNKNDNYSNSLFNMNNNWGKKSSDEIRKRENQVITVAKESELSSDSNELTIMISLSRDEVLKIVEEGKTTLFFKKLPVRPVTRVVIYMVKSNDNPGMVIGEFDILKTDVSSKSKAWDEYGKTSTLRRTDFYKYYDGAKKVHAMIIDDFIPYSIPKGLKDYGMNKGPAGFCYLK